MQVSQTAQAAGWRFFGLNLQLTGIVGQREDSKLMLGGEVSLKRVRPMRAAVLPCALVPHASRGQKPRSTLRTNRN